MSSASRLSIAVALIAASAAAVVLYDRHRNAPLDMPSANFTPPPRSEAEAHEMTSRSEKTGEVLNFGYTPDAERTKEFLKSMPGGKQSLQEQAPELFEGGNGEAVFLYRSLNQAYEQKYPGAGGWKPHRQAIGDCFVLNTMVVMADGTERPIQDVRVGDYVLNHKGVSSRVVDTIKKKFTGDLVTIKARGYSVPITATPDHAFVSYPGIKFGSGTGKSNFKVDATPHWRPIGELSVGDRILLTKPRIPTEGTTTVVSGKAVDFNESLGRLIGIYLAEGGLSKHKNGSAYRVDLSLGRHEDELIKSSIKLFDVCFGEPAVIGNLPSKPSVSLVRCNRSSVARFIQGLIPGNVYSKFIPPPIFSSDLKTRLACIRGWLEGDGNIQLKRAAVGGRLQASGVSASLPLLHSMYRLSLMSNIKPMLRYRARTEGRAPSGDLFFYGTNAISVFPEIKNEALEVMNRRGFKFDRSIVEDGIAAPISSIDRRHVDDEDVYCLTVEGEHSFVANGYGVHNCVSHGWALSADMHLAVLWRIKEIDEWPGECATESIYGGSRVEARGLPGDGSRPVGGFGDGSYGAAAAKWVSGWGVIVRGKYSSIDLTAYSGNTAKEWGAYGNGGRGDNGRLDAIAKQSPIKKVALVRNFTELSAAIKNGYTVAVCSNQGFSSRRDANGFASPSGSWAHCMMFSSVRFDINGALCENSWGSWNSGPKWPSDQPDGSFWVDERTVNRMLSGNDSFAVSGFKDGFRKLNHKKGWDGAMLPVNLHFALAGNHENN